MLRAMPKGTNPPPTDMPTALYLWFCSHEGTVVESVDPSDVAFQASPTDDEATDDSHLIQPRGCPACGAPIWGPYPYRRED